MKVSDSIIDFSQYESGGVTSVKGIEFFTNLRVLDCSANDIKELDVSKNTALTKLQCSHNKLKVLDLYRNPNLDHLSCAFNDIYYIDIRNCPKLELVNEKGYSISFSGSMAGNFYPGRQYVIKDEKGADIAYYLSADSIIGTSKDPLIDVAIDEVFPDPVFKKYIKDHFDWNGDGRLSSLESGNAGIIDCSGTEAQIGEIKSLEGIRFLPNLDTLKCDHNQISSLDVSRCDRLTKLYCNDNPMTTLKLIDHERDNEYEKEDDVDEDDGYEEEYEYRNYKLKEVFCYNCNLTELDVHNCVCIEYAYIDGEATADQNTYTFSEPEDDAILKIDKGVKIITDEWSSRDDLE